MENVTEMLIALIGKEICRKELPTCCQQPISEKLAIALHSEAKRHAVANILSAALTDNNLLDGSPIKPHFENEIYTAVYVYEKFNRAYEKICAVFENEKIPYIPLKGAVIRNLYPQPWLRSSCDIDILVKKEDLQRALDRFTSNDGYVIISKGIHDVTLKSEDGILFELHFALLGDKESPIYSEFIENVWDYAEPVASGKYFYRLTDEMFYYYHIVHMAKHFRIGGCGLRPFLDLWLIAKDKNYDTPKVSAMLKKGNLQKFNLSVRHLCDVWFSDEDHDETTLLIEKFIMDGGSFGSKETRLLSDNQRSGGKFKFILSKAFVPYGYLKGIYPILEKYPVLTPFCEICRLFSLLFGKKRKLRKNRLKKVNNVPQKDIEDINLLFERV